MRNERTSLDAKDSATLSFSAQSTGSLSFVTSTASPSREAARAGTMDAAARASARSMKRIGDPWGQAGSRTA